MDGFMQDKGKKEARKNLVERLKNASLKPLAVFGSAVALAFITGCDPINYKVAFHPNGDKMVMGMMQYNENGVPNIAYSAFAEEKFFQESDLYMMDFDGKDLINITNTKDTAEIWPSISNDGNLIAYSVFSDKSNPQKKQGVYIKDVDYDPSKDEYTFGDERLVVEDKIFPDISPDGQWISALNSSEIWIGDLYGKGINVELPNDCYWAGWSPDSERLAAVTNSKGLSDIPSAIYIFNRDGSNIKEITKEDTINFWPEWDRDSRHIYFVSNMKDKTPDEFEMIKDYQSSFPVFKAKYRNESIKNENFQIYRMNIETGSLKLLTPHLREDIMSICPELSPNGRILAYVERKKSEDNIWLMDRNGENKRKLTRNSFEHLGPIWWTPNGDRLVCVSSRGIFNVDARTGDIEKITGYVESQARFIEMAAFFEDKLLEYATKCELQEAIGNINGLAEDFTKKYDKLRADFESFKSGIESKVNKLWEEHEKNNPVSGRKTEK